jgi:exopolysaccharide biosynthesis protein
VAFQSYPTLLTDDGTVPRQLRAPGAGVDLHHRDARLAIGQTRDGALLVALTRFDAGGSALDFLPFGFTTPEMAAVMGALGARDAVMLDGGISGQMRIGTGADVVQWNGLRDVPLALIAVPR